MKHAGVRWFSAVCRAAGAPRAATRADPGTRAGAKHHYLLELQWQGVGGRFRHIVFNPPGLRQVLGSVGIVALLGLALGVVGAFPVGSDEALGHPGIDAIVRENAELRARQDALRERAFDLAEQLYERVEQGRKMAWMASTPGHAGYAQCPRPPARGAGDEAILAWLSEQGPRLEALGNELTAGRGEVGVKLASAPAPGEGVETTGQGEPTLHVADMGLARPPGAPAGR